MKTIEEFANEISEEQTFGIFIEPVYEAIIATAEFIQRWIPFTEELPPHDIKILVKLTHGEIHTFTFTGKSDIKSSANYLSYESWRHIELK